MSQRIALLVVYGCWVAYKTLLTARSELRLLEEFLSGLRKLFNLGEGKLLLWQEIIHSFRVFRGDVVDLRQVLLLQRSLADRVSDTGSVGSHLDNGVVHFCHHLGRVLMRVVSGFIAHHTFIELRSLGIFALLTFMRIVALPRDDGVGYGVGSFGSIRPESVLEAVRHILLVAGVIRINAHRAVKV